MRKNVLMLITILAASINSMAFDDVKVSGFATVAGGYISDETVGATAANLPDPTTNKDDSSYDGHDGYNQENVQFQPDSVAALQISARIAEDVSMTIQMIGRFEDDEAEVNLEWAYINYDFSESSTIQVGRFRPSLYLLSNTLDVGYTYLWITPPSEVYGGAPISYADGANLLMNHTFENDVTIEAAAFYANVNQDLAISGQILPTNFHYMAGMDASISNDYFKLRAGYMKTEISMDTAVFDPIVTGLSETDGLKIEKAEGSFASVGLSVDVADIILTGEYVVRNVKDTLLVEDTTAYYGTLGYRMGDFTPHVTYSVLENEYNESDTDPTILFVRSGQAVDSETITAGLRYEVNARTALKLEYQSVDKSPLQLNALGDLEYETTDAELYKIALSVIF